MFINEAVVNVTIPLVSTGGRGVQQGDLARFPFAGRWQRAGAEVRPSLPVAMLGVTALGFIYFCTSELTQISILLKNPIPSSLFGHHFVV